jgi:HD-GYP domain-containing protein (c-di-GMP phosphodiesterase class II)
MDLIELQQEKLSLGMSLGYTLRDEDGRVLLAKGHRIETAQQLEGIRSRKKLFVEIDESEEGVRAMMSGITALNRAGAPIKDFSKYINLDKAGPSEIDLTGSIVQRWGDVESKLAGILASVGTTADFEKKLRILERFIQVQMAEDSTGSQFLLFNRAVTQFGGYSVSHSLLCSALVQSLAATFALSDDERRSLVCAALTMNVAMTRLQDQLAIQSGPLSQLQRDQVDIHATTGRQMLQEAGVSDAVWLDVVERHHMTLEAGIPMEKATPLHKMVKILQTVDRYTAAISPRKSRAGRNARESVRSVVVQSGQASHDEVGTSLVRLLGVCPPGTYVTLANGETAVVLKRGAKPGEPFVATLLNRNGEPIAQPRVCDTSRETLAVQSTLAGTSVRVNLNSGLMMRLIPRAN